MTATRYSSTRRRRANKGPNANPSKPLSNANRELFAQAIAKGIKSELAYKDAGYKGNSNSRRVLRTAKDIDGRIAFLLDNRIANDTKLRHKREQPQTDRKARIISQLEHIAFSDIRDAIQWRRVPIINDDGDVTGFENVMTFTPSDKLTKAQSAGLKKIGSKGGELNVEWHDPIAALEKLAKIEGLFQDGPSTVTTNNTVNQVNFGQTPALEAVRRLAFAIQKAQHSQQLIDVTPAKDDTSG
jgi:hypothetical protein